MPDEKLPQRTLRTSFWVALFFTLVFLARGQASIAYGLAIGSGLILFGMGTLVFAIPRLFADGNPFGKVGLGMITFLKLPIYGVVLYFAMSSRSVNPIALAAGVALVPAVLVSKVLSYKMIQRTNEATGETTCRS